MVKPAGLGSSVGMTLVHDAGRARRRARPGLPLRHRRPRRGVPGGRARPRGVGHRQRPRAASRSTARARSSAATSSTTTPPSTRPACPRPRPGPRSTTAQRAILHKLSRDVYRAIGAEGFARIDFLVAGDRIVVSEINTIPGFTPISLFPTMPAEGGYTFTDVCRAHRRAGRGAARRPAGAAPSARPTCRDDPALADPARAPARPATRRPHAEAPIRRTPTVRRASAGLSPVRAGAMLAMLLSAAAIYGVANSTAFEYRDLRLEGADLHRPRPRSRQVARRTSAARTCSGCGPARWRRPLAELPTGRARRPSASRLPDTLVVRRRGARGRSSSGGSASGATSSMRDGQPVRPARRRAAGRGRRPAGHRGSAGGLGRAVASGPTRAGRPRRGDPARLARAGRRRQRGRGPGGRRSPTRTASSCAPGPTAGRPSSASTRRACARPSSSPARSACCAACSSAASRSSSASSSPRRPTGPTSPSRRPSRRTAHVTPEPGGSHLPLRSAVG